MQTQYERLALQRGDFLAAADHNVFVAVGVPIVAVTWIVWILSSALGRPFTLPKVPNWLIGTFAAAMGSAWQRIYAAISGASLGAKSDSQASGMFEKCGYAGGDDTIGD